MVPHVGKKTVSLNGGPELCSDESSAELTDLLGQVFDREWKGVSKSWGKEKYDRLRHSFIFHMTDWLGDLKKLTAVMEHPQDTNPKAAWDAIFGFMIHAMPHLHGAARLMQFEIGDPFTETATH